MVLNTTRILWNRLQEKKDSYYLLYFAWGTLLFGQPLTNTFSWNWALFLWVKQ